MVNQILADYYEEKGFARKAKRLRKRRSLVIFGYYGQYNGLLYLKQTYGYSVGLGLKYIYVYLASGDGCLFYYGSGYGYRFGCGWSYRWPSKS